MKDNKTEAYYSSVRGNTLYIGDGELVTVELKVAEKYVNGLKFSYKSKEPVLNITEKDTDGKDVIVTGTFDGSELEDKGIFTAKICDDYTEDVYEIIEGYVPTYDDKTYYADSKKTILPEDFKLNLWVGDLWEWGGTGCNGASFLLTNTKNASAVYAHTFLNGQKIEGLCLDYKINFDNMDESDTKWSRKRDKSLDGKCYSKKEFEECA